MSAVVTYLKCGIEIIVLNAQTGMDTKSRQYVDLCKAALCAANQVCLGVKTGSLLMSLQNYCVALHMRQLMNNFVVSSRTYSTKKLSSDPSVSVAPLGIDQCHVSRELPQAGGFGISSSTARNSSTST